APPGWERRCAWDRLEHRPTDWEAQMNANKALWEKGDFTRIASTMRESGEARGEKVRAGASLRVLDLGCGDGTTAIPAAQRGADVLGVDIAANLVAAGNRRAKELRVQNCWHEAREGARPHELQVPGGRRHRHAGRAGSRLRSPRQHLRRDVRAQAVRC